MITGTKPRPFLHVAMEKQFYLKGIGPDPIIGVARKTIPPTTPTSTCRSDDNYVTYLFTVETTHPLRTKLKFPITLNFDD